MIVRRDGRGGVALRAAHLPGGKFKLIDRKCQNSAVSLQFDSAIGRQSMTVTAHTLELPVIRVTTELMPATDLLVPFFSRDVYPLDRRDDPQAAVRRQRSRKGPVRSMRTDYVALSRFTASAQWTSTAPEDDRYRPIKLSNVAYLTLA